MPQVLPASGANPDDEPSVADGHVPCYDATDIGRADAIKGMDRHVIWSKTRELVNETIHALAENELSLERMVPALDRLRPEADENPHAVVEALAEHVNGGSFRERTIAALFIRKIAQERPKLVRPQSLKLAQGVLVSAVESENEYDRLFACLMMMGYVPTECIPAVFRMACQEDGESRYAAAAALSTVDMAEVQSLEGKARASGGQKHKQVYSITAVLQTLEGGMAKHMDARIRVLCAAGFVRLMQKSPARMQKVVEVLRSIDDERKWVLLVALRQANARSSDVESVLVELMTNTAESGVIRGGAAEALGALAEDSKRASHELSQLLNTDDVFIVRGAFHGLRHGKMVPAGVEKQCQALLSSEREEIRMLAMEWLAEVPIKAPETVEALINRVGCETGKEATRALIRALGAAGAKSVPALIEIIKTRNPNDVIVACLALSAMGVDGVRAILDAVRKGATAELLEALTGVVMQLGTAAEPVVPQFAEDLEASEDGEKSCALIVCIYATHTTNPVAARGLIAAVLYAQGEIAAFAERALRVIGAPAVPIIEEALAEDTGGEVGRLSRLYKELAGGRPSEPELRQASQVSKAIENPDIALFGQFGNDRPLMTFVYVGRVWSKNGPMSLREVAKIIETHVQNGLGAPGYKPKLRTIGEHLTWVQKKMKQFEIVSEPLTGVEMRKVGGLTPTGVLVLARLEAYFQAKYGKRLE